MFTTEVKDGRAPQVLRFSAMKDGEIGRVVDKKISAYMGDTVLKAFHSVVSLTTVGRIWDKHADLEVELLPVGSIVTITITGRD